jgi:hypothetical protein
MSVNIQSNNNVSHSTAGLRILRVPQDFKSINDALNFYVNSLFPSTIKTPAILELVPGIYDENVELPSHVSIRGVGVLASQVVVKSMSIGMRCMCPILTKKRTHSCKNFHNSQCYISSISIGELTMSSANAILQNVVILDKTKDENSAITITNSTLMGHIMDITGNHPTTPAIRAINSTISLFGGGITNGEGIAISIKDSVVNCESTDIIGRIMFNNEKDEMLIDTNFMLDIPNDSVSRDSVLMMKYSSISNKGEEPLIATSNKQDRVVLLFTVCSGKGLVVKSGIGQSYRVAICGYGNAKEFEGGVNIKGNFI